MAFQRSTAKMQTFTSRRWTLIVRFNPALNLESEHSAGILSSFVHVYITGCVTVLPLHTNPTPPLPLLLHLIQVQIRRPYIPLRLTRPIRLQHNILGVNRPIPGQIRARRHGLANGKPQTLVLVRVDGKGARRLLASALCDGWEAAGRADGARTACYGDGFAGVGADYFEGVAGVG
jgi:hypothetical protein